MSDSTVHTASDERRHIALVGFMGAGKTCVARELATRYGRARIDLDDSIEELTGKKVSAIFQEDGERRFRELEREALQSALASPGNCIIACGGGTVTNPESLAALRRSAVVVYLAVSPERALARIDDWTSRPLLSLAGSTDAIYALAQSRLALYEAASDFSVKTDQRSIDEVADCVVRRLKEAGYDYILA
ncbi:MAG: shikimate kinase [Coriobacteriia bacterium]|nr:shikimate kinase [Coriobacteriia bacterium]MCL2536691.1 shikimate kinase [Coriobacteriia bacterium]